MKIIAAVSGGVDSCVMLHGLVAGRWQMVDRDGTGSVINPNYQLPTTSYQIIVAHVDHGLRPDSAADARFVAALAERYGLPFEQTRLELDSDSEAAARAGRWQFLRAVRDRHGADVVATAHHQDDVIETMLINLLRGTNRKGLTSLSETPEIKRPLLGMTKSQIYKYALKHKLEWVRDESNLDDKYLRNRVRRYLVPQLSDAEYRELLEIYSNLTRINAELDSALATAAEKLSTSADDATFRIESNHFKQLPSELQRELFAQWWYQLTDSPPPDSLQLNRMVEAIAVDKTGNVYQLANGVRLKIYRGYFKLYRI